MTRPHFRPIAPLDVDDTALERVNERLGVPTMVRPAAKVTQTDGVTASRQPVEPPRRQRKLTTRIPGYLTDELKQKALDQRTTVRLLLLLALKKDGYRVDPEDLLPGAGGSD
jgi:hypothetical protein